MVVTKINEFAVSIGKIVSYFCLLFILVACSGGSTDGNINNGSSDSVESAELTLSGTDVSGNSFDTITKGESVTFTVTANDESNNNAISAVQIDFVATSGLLSAPSKLTDTNGQAQISYNSTDASVGVNSVTVTATINDQTYNKTFSFNVLDIPETSIQIGSFNESNVFLPNVLQTSKQDSEGNTSVDAGSAISLTLHIVDQNLSAITDSLLVTFNSSCVQAENATIDSQVFSNNGLATSTYQDINCATAAGNEDVIVATVTINSVEYNADIKIDILPENIGSIEFVSAEPLSIVLKGTGGQGKQESSTLTFLVKSELNNVLSLQEVDFSLSSSAGGLSLVSDSGITNASGFVTAKVLSGTAPTAVRVTASVSDDVGTISTQSDLLSINTGLPDQDSITLAFSETNPEARNFPGKEVTVTAFLADSINNPVPDGTTVNFTTEGGAIEATCNTVSGNCSVIWTSQEPYINNHRVTILATAIGHETFVDVNGNNVFDDVDGGVSTDDFDDVFSGFGRSDNELTSGFIDMPEAWRDDNENDTYDTDEYFIDFNNNETRDDPDGKFNGPQCHSDTYCQSPVNTLGTIRKAKVLITSSSDALFKLTHNDSGDILDQNYGSPTLNTDPIEIVRDGVESVQSFTISISDSQFQTMPINTVISVTTTVGELSGDLSRMIPNTVGTDDPEGFGGSTLNFKLLNNLAADDDAASGSVSVTITTPNLISTVASFTVNLN